MVTQGLRMQGYGIKMFDYALHMVGHGFEDARIWSKDVKTVRFIW